MKYEYWQCEERGERFEEIFDDRPLSHYRFAGILDADDLNSAFRALNDFGNGFDPSFQPSVVGAVRSLSVGDLLIGTRDHAFCVAAVGFTPCVIYFRPEDGAAWCGPWSAMDSPDRSFAL